MLKARSVLSCCNADVLEDGRKHFLLLFKVAPLPSPVPRSIDPRIQPSPPLSPCPIRRCRHCGWIARAGAASAGKNAGSRCRGYVASGVLTSPGFPCTEARRSVFVQIPITPVDYEENGDNYTLSQLSRGHCQDSGITFGPLWEGCDRDMGMMEARAAFAKITVALERRRQGRIT